MSTGQAEPNGTSAQFVTVPSHCAIGGAIGGAIEPRTGADGKSYAINVQVRLPATWNGRLMYQGAGGLNGTVRVGDGTNTSLGTTAAGASSRLLRGMYEHWPCNEAKRYRYG